MGKLTADQLKKYWEDIDPLFAELFFSMRRVEDWSLDLMEDGSEDPLMLEAIDDLLKHLDRGAATKIPVHDNIESLIYLLSYLSTPVCMRVIQGLFINERIQQELIIAVQTLSSDGLDPISELLLTRLTVVDGFGFLSRVLAPENVKTSLNILNELDILDDEESEYDDE